MFLFHFDTIADESSIERWEAEYDLLFIYFYIYLFIYRLYKRCLRFLVYCILLYLFSPLTDTPQSISSIGHKWSRRRSHRCWAFPFYFWSSELLGYKSLLYHVQRSFSECLLNGERMMVSIAGLENSARLMGPVTQYLVWRHCPARRGLGYRDTGDWWQVSPGDWGQCSCYLQWRPRDTPLSHGWWHGWWRWDSFRERRYLATIWGRGHWCDPGWKYQSTKRIPLKWLIKNFAAVYKINIHRRSIHKLCLCTIRSLSSHIMFHRLCLSMVLSLISLSLEFLITWSLDFLITIKFARDKIRNRLDCC